MNYILGVVIAGLVAAIGWQSIELSNERADHAKTVTAYAQAKEKAAGELAKVTAGARQKEQALQASANQDRREADETIEALTRQRNALRAERLRDNAATNAAKLPATTEPPGTAQAGSEPDRAELSGQIGSAEEDEALRADMIRIELMGCYRAYDRAASQAR